MTRPSAGPSRPRRNTRPRDGLGRPLPYGAAGIEPVPMAPTTTPAEALDHAQELLDAGLPFHAHEVLEDAWRVALEPERALWRGLAQLAVGLTHSARGNQVGAVSLLHRGAATIEPYERIAPHGIDVAGLRQWAEQAARLLTEDPSAHPGIPRLRRPS